MAVTKAVQPASSSGVPETVLAPDGKSYVEVRGLIFDPANFPFTLLELLVLIANEMRELGLEKTGGKASDDPSARSNAKYGYFEEAEIAAHLTPLLKKHEIGYAAGTSKITGRFEAGKTHSGATMWAHHVSSAAIFSHKKSREWIIVPGVGEAFDSGDKSITKAITSAIKYIWMKTFLVSEGNDIEVEQHQDEELGNRTQSKSQTAGFGQLKCSDCKKAVGPVETKDETIPPREVAARTKKKFGVVLCGGCAQKRAEADKPKTQTKASNRQTDDDGNGIETIESTVEKCEARKITAKGKKRTIYDLTLHGGIRITDWHESHHELYEDGVQKGEHIKVVVDVSQNGKYTNRNVKALMELGDLCIEDEEGNNLEEQDSAFDGNEEMPWDNE